MTTTHQAEFSLTNWLVQRRIDATLLVLLIVLCALGLMVLYSASGQNISHVYAQSIRLGLGLMAMVAVAQIPPEWVRTSAPWLFVGCTVLLILVMFLGADAKGAQRWLDIKIIRFQPSEVMKLAMPIALAAYLHDRPCPINFRDLIVCLILIAIPTLLVVRQPDLGTAILIAAAGAFVLYMGGLRWRVMLIIALAATAIAPMLWFNLHEYQQDRLLTLFNPARDPAGAGYHITQSKIAIGSGGLFGKGWLNGTQAKLNFLPESNTDFVLAVFAEEGGLLGVLVLLLIYLMIVLRGLSIAIRSQDTFQRLLAGSLSLTFFVYVFVNMGMVIGILPVVGVPLPLVSYGGTSIVMLLAGFGLLMSIHTHRKLLAD